MVYRQICSTTKEMEAFLVKLKLTACPHCKRTGSLIRHGFLHGYEEKNHHQKTVRAHRVFCSNRNRQVGCGHTFSVWLANKIRRLLLSADSLWAFLKQAVTSGNKLQAFRDLKSGLSDSTPYRIWKRFQAAQSAIRTALQPLCEPPQIPSPQPAALTVAHLEAAYQVTLQTFCL